MPLTLVINADDFGITPGVNRAVIEAHRLGTVTSASIMTNGAAFDGAVRAAREHPGLGIGVHVNLVQGRPLLPAQRVPSLVDRDGRFLDLPRLVLRLLAGRISQQELELEIGVQVERALDAGLPVDHLDGHRHAHLLPGIVEVTAAVCARHEVRWMRAPPFAAGLSLSRHYVARVKEVAVLRFGRHAVRVLREARIGTTDRFFDCIHLEGRDYVRRLRTLLEELGEGVVELACHPGADAVGLQGVEARVHDRRFELRILTDSAVVELLQGAELRTARFADLAAPIDGVERPCPS